MDIILGLLFPTKGDIKIDDIVIDKKNLPSWQTNIGYVSQSIYISDDTYKKNIAFGIEEKEINDSMVDKAVNFSQLDKLMDDLPNGVNTSVGESGVRISGGQRQRIGIARALYHNPSVLVLDEATSALDNDTEKDVMQAINKMQNDKTIIIIAHRLSTVQNCDHIIELDNGRIVKTGTPAEML